MATGPILGYLQARPAPHHLVSLLAYLWLVFFALGCGQAGSADRPRLDTASPSRTPESTPSAVPTPRPFSDAPLPSQASPSPVPLQTTAGPSHTPAKLGTPRSSTPTPAPAQPPLQPVQTFAYGLWEGVSALAWSPDGSFLAVAAGERVHLYRSAGFTEQRTFSLSDWAGSLEFSPGSDYLVAAVRSGEVLVWDVLAGETICTIQAHARGANRATWSPAAPILATAGDDPIVVMWDVSALQSGSPCLAAPLGELIGAARAVPDLEFSPAESVLASIDGQAIRLRDPATLRLVTTLRTEAPVFDLAYHPGGTFLASAGPGPALHIWDAAAGQPAASWPGEPGGRGPGIPKFPPGAFAWAIAFHPGGNLLAAGTSTGQVLLWDWRAGNDVENSWSWSAHRRAVPALAFSPDGHLLATGGLDAKLQLWEIRPEDVRKLP